MATSLIGPALLVASAFEAAPVPRPPQPTSATWIVLLPAAWTWGMATPARAEAAAMRPVVLINSRRVLRCSDDSFISDILRRLAEQSQFKNVGYFPQQCLNFFPLPQGHGSLRPTLGPARTGLAFSMAAAASLTMSLPCCGPARGFFAAESDPVVVPPNALVVWCVVCCGTLRRKFSKAIRLEALRKMLWQISVLMLTINSSKILKASALYSISGSRWPCARRPML